jgi:hypothetical protein
VTRLLLLSPKKKKPRVEPSTSTLDHLSWEPILPFWNAENQPRGNTPSATDIFGPIQPKTLTPGLEALPFANEPLILDLPIPRNRNEEEEDEMGDENTPWQGGPPTKGTFLPPLTSDEARLAIEDIKHILNPPQKKGPGHVDLELDLLFHSHLEGMQQFLWAYVNPNSATCGNWTTSSIQTADVLEWKPYYAR